MARKPKDWYPGFIKRLAAKERKEQELNSGKWLRMNEERGKDEEYQKSVKNKFFKD